MVKGDDPEFLPAALWGLCRYVGRRNESDMFLIDEDLQTSPKDLTLKVLTLISA
jgi:hypothetical protein